MLQRILVPLDGSALAEMSLRWAELFAEPAQATVILLRAAFVPAGLAVDPAAAEARAVEQARSYIERVASRLRERGLRVESAVPCGEAGEAIVDCAIRHGADLIAMAIHRSSSRNDWIYGPVVDYVLRNVMTPILTLHAGTAPSSTSTPLRTIVVPLDGSAVAEMALPWAEDLAGLLQARVLVVEVIEEPAPDDRRAQQVAEAHAYLHAAAEPLRRAGLKVVYDVRSGAPSSAINDYAREVMADLIVIATQGQAAIGRLPYGTVAADVLRGAPAPVLLIRPRAIELARTATRGAAGARDAALLAASVGLTLSGRQVLLLREAVSSMLWVKKEDEQHAAQLRELLNLLPTAEALRSQVARGAAPSAPQTGS